MPANTDQSPSLEGSIIPHHVAIVMDGNGRWAKQHSLPRFLGHREGVKAARQIVETCRRRGVEVLTLFAFSSENWRRPQREVSLLMDLFVTTLRSEIRRLDINDVCVRFIGDRDAFSAKLQSYMEQAETLTASNTGLVLVIAANYGGRWDITQAARQLAEEVKAGRLSPQEITVERLNERMCLYGLPEPDLFIRTGGEQRISNFLLWQMAYTELYFTDRLWPDFDDVALDEAFAAFAKRQRRFGRTGDQVEQDSAGA